MRMRVNKSERKGERRGDFVNMWFFCSLSLVLYTRQIAETVFMPIFIEIKMFFFNLFICQGPCKNIVTGYNNLVQMCWIWFLAKANLVRLFYLKERTSNKNNNNLYIKIIFFINKTPLVKLILYRYSA